LLLLCTLYVCILYCQSLQLLCPLWVLNWSKQYSSSSSILYLSYNVTKPNTIAKLSQTSFLPLCCGFVYEVRSYAVCYRVLPTLNMNQDNYILVCDRMSQTFIQALSVSCSNKTSAGVIIITKYCISHGNMYNSTTISLSREKQIN